MGCPRASTTPGTMQATTLFPLNCVRRTMDCFHCGVRWMLSSPLCEWHCCKLCKTAPRCCCCEVLCFVVRAVFGGGSDPRLLTNAAAPARKNGACLMRVSAARRSVVTLSHCLRPESSKDALHTVRSMNKLCALTCASCSTICVTRLDDVTH
jgi:hypothetical protein